MSRLAARGIRIAFGGLAVLDGVDLTIGPGDRVGIVAPNGVGKSTPLKVLAGELEPDSGYAYLAEIRGALVGLSA